MEGEFWGEVNFKKNHNLISLMNSLINYNSILDKLKTKWIQFNNWLSYYEITEIEKKFWFQFPPDLSGFLNCALPISHNFYNWREGLIPWNKEEERIFDMINWPLNWMLFDIEFNDFWIDDFWKKPSELEKKKEIASKYYYDLPKLIPIYSHRYLPSMPHKDGNPVFSIYQTDIIIYWINLENYFLNEFTEWTFVIPEKGSRFIPFWSKLVVLNNLTN